MSKLYKKLLPYGLIAFVVISSTVVLWLPFLFKNHSWFGLNFGSSDFHSVYKQYDGPFYIIPAKTFYDVNKIDIPNKGFILSFPLSAKYFAAHLPLYPAIIRIFAPLLGYLRAMIFSNLLATVLLGAVFYFVVKKLNLGHKPLLLSLIFLFLPRFLVVRSAGAPESLFMLLIIISLYFFEKEDYFIAGLAGGLATMTKTPGILLFAAYGLVLTEKIFFERSREVKKSNRIKWLWLLLIPLGLFLVFLIYQFRYNDFFAYFHSGGFVPLVFPFSVFNSQAKWVGTAWLEDILFYFFLYFLAVLKLKDSKHRSLFYFSLVFLIATTFVQHRDVSRYSLPLWPFALIAFHDFFTSRKFLIAFLILLPAIYLFAWNFLMSNQMPIADWAAFL